MDVLFIGIVGVLATVTAIATFTLLRPRVQPQAMPRALGDLQETGDDAALAILLEQAGSSLTPREWRANRSSRTLLYAVAGAVMGILAGFTFFGLSLQTLIGGIGFAAASGYAGWASRRSALRSAARERVDEASGQLVEVGAVLAQRIRAHGTNLDAIEAAATICSHGVLRDELARVYDEHVHNQTPLPKCLAAAQRRIDDATIHDLYRALARHSDTEGRIEDLVRRVSAARSAESDERIQVKTGTLSVKAGTLHVFAGAIVLGGFPIVMAVLRSLQGGLLG